MALHLLSYIFQFLFFSLMHTGRTWPSCMPTSRSRGNYMARDSSFNGRCGLRTTNDWGLIILKLSCVVVIICDSLLMQISTKNSISFFFFIFQMWSHNYLNTIVYVSDVSINCGDFTNCNSFKLLSSGNFKVRLDLDWALWGVSQWQK